jgi:hypothetical protein
MQTNPPEIRKRQTRYDCWDQLSYYPIDYGIYPVIAEDFMPSICLVLCIGRSAKATCLAGSGLALCIDIVVVYWWFALCFVCVCFDERDILLAGKGACVSCLGISN